MLTGITVAGLTRKVAEMLSQVETLSTWVLMVVLVEEGCPKDEAPGIVSLLAKSGIIASCPAAGTGQVSLTAHGRALLRDVEAYVAKYGENPIIRSTGKRAYPA